MKYLSTLVASVVTALVFAVSPVIAGDAFSDLFSQTKICFSQIAVNNGWETEVAVINPTAKTVTGNFTFYDMVGNQLGGAVSKTLKANGRYQVEVGATFSGRGNIEYMIFTAPVYGLKGYSKFYNNNDGVRASIMASAPQKTGLFTKIDHEGWTGIAFVNTADSDASVILTAYSDSGVAVAVVPMKVKAGEKKVEVAKTFFAPQPIDDATYISFESDQGIVGFFLNGTSDKLDGSKAL
ncbi:MAG TPA: hypothetical protein EYP64_06105 [Desulfarculaceae bacterium]|nr:hypothetical protein [Desulfarculaceae bacterium]